MSAAHKKTDLKSDLKPDLKSDSKSEASSETRDDTAGRISAAATRLFAQKGYGGTSTKEICEAAKVNIAAIHYHFGSKEELYRSIIQKFGASHIEAAERTLKIPHNKEEFKVRLEMYMEEILVSLLKEPDIPRMIHREFEMGNLEYAEFFMSTFMRLFETLANFLSQAKKAGFISKEIDPKFAANVLFAQISQTARMSEKGKDFMCGSLTEGPVRTKWIQQTVQVFLHGVAGQ